MVMLNEPFLFDDLHKTDNQQRKDRMAAIEQGIIAIEMMMEMYQDNDSEDEVAILVQHAVVLSDLLNSLDLP
jgi:hypothetical protein